MKRLLILFANSFPYNFSEPFLENEYPLYKEYFHKVLIVTGCQKGEPITRQLEEPFFEVLPDYTLSRDVPSMLAALPWMLTDRLFYAELRELFREGFSVSKLYDLVVMSLCGNHRAMQVYRWLKKHPEYTFDSLYSYWINIPAYAAIRLRNKLKRPDLRITARCHGYDIYKDRKPNGYLPCQGRIIQELDAIGAASADAKNYLESQYGPQSKLSVYYLGARDVGQRNPVADRDPFRLVSCAHVTAIKRLTKIVDALALITDRKIRWTHIGDGQDLNALKEYAAQKLPANVQAVFLGNIPNTQIYQVYRQEPFHAFISVSRSEGGAPVSICEAISFGLPIIATAVGGHPDVVEDGVNGFLIERDYEDPKLAGLIMDMADMDADAYLALRSAARRKYEEKFDAVKNNKEYIEAILLANKLKDENGGH